jgi:hypothetical protein
LDLLNTYRLLLQVTITLSLICSRCSSLQYVLSLLILLCLHQSLPGDGYQPCPLFPCSRSYRLVTASKLTHCQCQSYVTTDGQSTSLFWCQAPIWGPRLDFYYCQTVMGLLMWAALSEERMGMSFTIAAGPRRHSHSRVQVPRDS